MRAARIVVVLVLAVALLAAIAPDEPAAARVRPFRQGRRPVSREPRLRPDHRVAAGPYLNRLARRGALATPLLRGRRTRRYRTTSRSRPARRTASRATATRATRPAPSLAGQLDAAHISWRAYFESIPAPGTTGRGAGTYTKHYNPFAYSERSGERSAARHVLGFGSLRHDLRRGTLPRFSWIAPNLVHDGHNGSVRASDRFAARLVPRIERALGPDGVLFVTWDEAQGVTGPARRPRGADRDRPGSAPRPYARRPGRPLLAAGHARVRPGAPAAGQRRGRAGGAGDGPAPGLGTFRPGRCAETQLGGTCSSWPLAF